MKSVWNILLIFVLLIELLIPGVYRTNFQDKNPSTANNAYLFRSEYQLAESETPDPTTTEVATEIPADTPDPTSTPEPLIINKPTEELESFSIDTAFNNINAQTQISSEGGEISALSDKVKIKFPKDENREDVEVFLGDPADEMIPYSLSGEPIEIVALSTKGKNPVKKFDKPVEIRIKYNPKKLNGDEFMLTLFYFDETKQTWIPLPSQIDYEKKELIATTDHFSIFDFDTQNWQSAMLPSLESAQVASFTGAATYSMPIEVPPAPGGLTPRLSLNYNSQVVDDADNLTQASWVGMGWSLETGYIRRDMHGTGAYAGLGDDTFMMNIYGESHLLLPVDDDPDHDANTDDYRTADESFWLIRHYIPYSTSNCPTDQSYWIAYSTTGEKYYFEDRAQYPAWGCNSSTGKPTTETWQWSMTKITNKFNQSLIFTYSKESSTKIYGEYSREATIAVYPESILYPNRGCPKSKG